MATRTKTTEWGFTTDTATLTAATRRDLAAITLYIPESSPTFRSVTCEVSFSDDATAAANITSYLIGIKLGAVAFSDATVTTTVTNSGEAQTYKLARDVTSYFTSNWSGTSMTCQVGIQVGGRATQNHTARLLVTYEYSDAGSTYIKTVRIPIESTRQTLSTSWQTVGGATAIPALAGGSIVLPENSVTVRHAHIEMMANTSVTTATDFTVEARINGGAAQTVYDYEAALISAVHFNTRWDITSSVAGITAAQSFEMQTVGVTTVVGQVCAVLVVTYEYSEASTSTVRNSLAIPWEATMTRVASSTTALRSLVTKRVWVEEPTTITLKESGILIRCNSAANVTMNVSVGAQGETSYVLTAGSVTSGMFTLMHRLDAGGTAGVDALTLARGENVITIELFTSSGSAFDVSGLIYLNYDSGKAAGGTHDHNHTVHAMIAPSTSTTTVAQDTTLALIAIPETSYFLNGFGTELTFITSADLNWSWSVSATIESGEGEEAVGDGWISYTAGGWSDTENANNTTWIDWLDSTRRYAGTLESEKIDIEASRTWRRDYAVVWWHHMTAWITWHSITFDAAGTLSGYTGDGSGVSVVIHDSNNDRPLTSATSAIGGTFAATWYDDTQYIYAQARQDGTHLGRSERGLAT